MFSVLGLFLRFQGGLFSVFLQGIQRGNLGIKNSLLLLVIIMQVLGKTKSIIFFIKSRF